MCQILSSRVYFTFSTTVFAVGTVIAGLAPSLTIFLIGRVVSGIGGAGIFNVITILILELTTDKNRGKFLGLLNAAFTIGVALGAVTAGGLAPVAGWVSEIVRPSTNC